MPDIIRSFLKDIPPSLTRLREAVQAGEWAEAQRLVHFIRPNLEALAVAGTAPPLAALEHLGSGGPNPVGPTTEAVDQLAAAVRAVLAPLSAELPAS
ncbi:hypothetical protein IC235_08270 [Hymenobacter sp. BT664]|uniref:HPt domain-containing protein n=1 Tax=Hymenobacter montanus TaxID=2771359 RepID=A0A927BBT8_9BACT|nr:hypothetical protein [Hymenobacter montanus]MBD2767887.1 hypothetical protein [Hymenobacter montanus]